MKGLDEKEQATFRKRLKRFVRLYSFMSQIAPYLHARSERLYVYARYLMNYLPRDERGGLNLGEDDVGLAHLRQVKTGEHKIVLEGTREAGTAFSADGGTTEGETEKVYGLVSLEINQVVDFFLTREEAENVRLEVIADEPDWIDTIQVIAVELPVGGLN